MKVPLAKVFAPKGLPPKVLIIEDDETIRDILGTLLEDDYAAITVATVKEALTVLEQEYVAVILLDYNLAGETGKAVADQANQVKIPVVWMTGDPESLGNSLVILPKPFNCQQVLDTLAEVCKPVAA